MSSKIHYVVSCCSRFHFDDADNKVVINIIIYASITSLLDIGRFKIT